MNLRDRSRGFDNSIGHASGIPQKCDTAPCLQNGGVPWCSQPRQRIQHGLLDIDSHEHDDSITLSSNSSCLELASNLLAPQDINR